MKWFKEGEFRCRCCGELPRFAKENLETLVEEVLDPAREAFGGPVRVNSGYRCQRHNAAVGGVANSQHLRGEAADIAPVKSEELRVKSELERLAGIIERNGRYDQMIIYPTFIHVSWKRNGGNRHQVLRKVASGYLKV